ncbi:tetratricopeptide repeat protein [Lacibacterium aquatile]|uniref:Tetratricopeptide repeat protein n=1 Tax=Lacibacterium aquatile TaxID=1168082 RepID=A0ABW5DRD2_9PROT
MRRTVGVLGRVFGLGIWLLAGSALAAGLSETEVNALYDADKLNELQSLVAAPARSGDAVGLLGAGAVAARKGDMAGAFDYFKKSADKGNARAMLTLGRFYLSGVGGIAARDPAIAADWVQKSHGAGLPEAALDLGMLHAAGQGVARSPEKAVQYYREAADKGVPTAAGLLAESLASSSDKAVRADGAAYARLAAQRMKAKDNRDKVAKLADLLMASLDDAGRQLADKKFADMQASVPSARDTRDLNEAKNDAAK